MVKNSYLGGSTIISRGGKGWSYDGCEVKNEEIERPKPLSKPKNTVKPTNRRPFKRLWKKYVDLTAIARTIGAPDPLLPVKIRHKFRKAGKSARFEREVEAKMLELQKQKK